MSSSRDDLSNVSIEEQPEPLIISSVKPDANKTICHKNLMLLIRLHEQKLDTVKNEDLNKDGSFAIPTTARVIDGFALSSCTELKKINIPASVSYIQDFTFTHDNPMLQQIDFYGKVTFVTNEPRYLESRIQPNHFDGHTIMSHASIAFLKGLEKINFYSGVTFTEDQATFRYCENLKFVFIYDLDENKAKKFIGPIPSQIEDKVLLYSDLMKIENIQLNRIIESPSCNRIYFGNKDNPYYARAKHQIGFVHLLSFEEKHKYEDHIKSIVDSVIEQAVSDQALEADLRKNNNLNKYSINMLLLGSAASTSALMMTAIALDILPVNSLSALMTGISIGSVVGAFFHDANPRPETRNVPNIIYTR